MDETFIKKIGKISLYVVQGDITQIPTDAIMTAINSKGAWYGGVDRAIQRVAGNQYHSRASEAMPLSDLQTVIAKGDASKHGGKFNDVVFVVDDLESSLDKVVYAGLEAAHKEGYGQLLIPAMRTGKVTEIIEELPSAMKIVAKEKIIGKTPEETIARLSQGIERFMHDYENQTKLENLTIVLYKDLNSR
ncbi:MAG: hypothetical protein NTV63_04215 [Candidatus Woesearchaeota archaeon]|nr:hypothetical protein [Candidatus Woesearchaeota archaeon]